MKVNRSLNKNIRTIRRSLTEMHKCSTEYNISALAVGWSLAGCAAVVWLALLF
jgi:hypothetical protein